MPFIIPVITVPATVGDATTTTDDLPQFAVPFRFNADGTIATIDQDTPEDTGGQIYNIITCQPGQKLNDPKFGSPSPLFANLPIDTTAIVNAVQRLVPDATITAIQQQIGRILAQQPVRIDVTGETAG